MGLTPAGERLVAAASDLFYRRGIRAVGVDLIAETAGTTKKTLYDRFGSKDALVALYLQRRAERWHAFRDGATAALPARRRLVAAFDVLLAWLADEDRGCGFVNAYAEIAGTDHPGVAVIRAEKADMRAWFVGAAQEAGLSDADRLGTELHLLYEGATVMATAGGLPDAVERARAAAQRLVAAESQRLIDAEAARTLAVL